MIPNQGGHRADEKELGEEHRSLFWCGYPLVSGGRMRRKGLSGNKHDTISSWFLYVSSSKCTDVAEEENHAVYAVAQNACQPMNSMCVLICVNPFSVWPCVLFDTFLAGAATGEVFAIKTIKKSKVRAGTCSIWYAVCMDVCHKHCCHIYTCCIDRASCNTESMAYRGGCFHSPVMPAVDQLLLCCS